jgi:plastocyanin
MTKVRIPALSSLSLLVLVVPVVLVVLLEGCGSSPSSPSSVTVIVRDGGTGPSGATITITSAGVSPKSVTVAVGQAVTVINNDSRSHEVASDPHPQHGSCPSMEAGLGTLAAGQTKVTHAFANAGTCTYHDHLDDTNSALKGSIVVQ